MIKRDTQNLSLGLEVYLSVILQSFGSKMVLREILKLIDEFLPTTWEYRCLQVNNYIYKISFITVQYPSKV